MSWLWIVIIAYALNAVAIAIDKALLRKAVPQPAAYTFYICALGGMALVLLPFDFIIPPLGQLVWNLVAGASFAAALYLMFTALKAADASRVTPFIGGLSPVFVLVLASLFLGERLGGRELIAFGVVVVGSLLISLNVNRRRGLGRAFLVALPSALFFAVSYTATKYVYLEQSFLSGFVWIRVGALLTALFFLLSPTARQAIFHSASSSGGGSRLAFFTGQASGALSMILVSWAINLSSVSLVNALQGLQYVFLFLIVLTLKSRAPRLLDEDLSPRVYTQKVVSIGLICLGLFLLAAV